MSVKQRHQERASKLSYNARKTQMRDATTPDVSLMTPEDRMRALHRAGIMAAGLRMLWADGGPIATEPPKPSLPKPQQASTPVKPLSDRKKILAKKRKGRG